MQSNLVRIRYIVIIRPAVLFRFSFKIPFGRGATMYSILILATGLGLAQAEEIKTVKSMQVANNVSFRVQATQELLYRGLFTEEARSSRVQFQRSYRVESRCLVLESNNNYSQLACLTLLKQHPTTPLLYPHHHLRTCCYFCPLRNFPLRFKGHHSTRSQPK